jgi:hypothetical protein
MKKVSIDGLLALSLEEIEIIYRRLRGDSVRKIALEMRIPEATVWNQRIPEIRKMLGVEEWKEIEQHLKIPLRSIIPSLQTLKSGWPEEFRQKIEALREPDEASTARTAATELPLPSVEQTTQSSTNSETVSIPSFASSSEQSNEASSSGRTDPVGARPRVPSWIFVGVPLLLICLILVVGIRFAWNHIPQFFPVASETSANTEGPTNVATSTLEEALVPNTPAATVEAIPTPADAAEPSPTPSQTPTQTSLPTLFIDQFNTGISPEWGMRGDNFNVVEGKLASVGTLHGIVGNGSWTNYAIEFNLDHLFWSYIEAGLRILVRYQDDANYMALAIKSVNGCDFRWLVVSGGVERVVVGSDTKISQDYKQCLGFWRIEVDGNRYKVSIDFEPRLEFFDDTFANGGTGIFVNLEKTEVKFDEFKVLPLP